MVYGFQTSYFNKWIVVKYLMFLFYLWGIKIRDPEVMDISTKIFLENFLQIRAIFL